MFQRALSGSGGGSSVKNGHVSVNSGSSVTFTVDGITNINRFWFVATQTSYPTGFVRFLIVPDLTIKGVWFVAGTTGGAYQSFSAWSNAAGAYMGIKINNGNEVTIYGLVNGDTAEVDWYAE